MLFLSTRGGVVSGWFLGFVELTRETGALKDS